MHLQQSQPVLNPHHLLMLKVTRNLCRHPMMKTRSKVNTNLSHKRSSCRKICTIKMNTHKIIKRIDQTASKQEALIQTGTISPQIHTCNYLTIHNKHKLNLDTIIVMFLKHIIASDMSNHHIWQHLSIRIHPWLSTTIW